MLTVYSVSSIKMMHDTQIWNFLGAVLRSYGATLTRANLVKQRLYINEPEIRRKQWLLFSAGEGLASLKVHHQSACV